MEYALREAFSFQLVLGREVLILVLMEYALRVQKVGLYKRRGDVLILVLMEYALRVHGSTIRIIKANYGLNPCFNGICSASLNVRHHHNRVCVLILVLMEYALRDKL